LREEVEQICTCGNHGIVDSLIERPTEGRGEARKAVTVQTKNDWLVER
jgi:hypothetical protein